MIYKYLAIAVIFSFATACSCFTPDEKPGLKTLSVAEVSAQIQQASPKPIILDANPDSVRSSKGTVPNAVLLTSYDQYALSELPADKATPLIFYCYNEACGASTQAANRALSAGYKNVSVMKGGITGWKAAHPG